ncbi:MAG TPA: DUF11 domain-containing protein, partial [Anaerolineae bacterium]|nr:DUF11 domain-containing protein [Anaerolineae bacterium]
MIGLVKCSGKASPLLFALLFSLTQAAAASSHALPYPVVSLSKMVQPGQVRAGAQVTYEITLTNSGDVAATGLRVADTLPTGFTYVWGSTQVQLNGYLISTANPSVSGRNLTWGTFMLPGRRAGSFYGVNSFVQEACNPNYINWQLDRVRELMGWDAWVKQLFYGITASTSGPQPCWVDFVNAAYDRGLRPVLRLQGVHNGSCWEKPVADGPGNYSSIAAAFRRVVEQLPRRDGHTLYVQIWNEPNLNLEWGGAASPTEYGHLLEQTAAAIRSIGDPRIQVVSGPLAPGGDVSPIVFIDRMVSSVPSSLWAWDVWGAHPYPANHPPEYNIHQGTATYQALVIDNYLPQLARLSAWGRSGVRVFLSETGYNLYNNTYNWEGYPTIDEANRTDYIIRAFRDYWRTWPEVIGVAPFELSDPSGNWPTWDWIAPSGLHHPQFDAVRDMDKSDIEAVGVLKIYFRAVAANTPGTYYNNVSASADNATIETQHHVAPVVVSGPTLTPTRPTATPTSTRVPSPTATPTEPAVTPTPTWTSLPTATPTEPAVTPTPTWTS